MSERHPGIGPDDDTAAELRSRMVERDLMARGITDERVLAAMRDVPRHLFLDGVDAADVAAAGVDAADLRSAYGDHPIPIGHGQTISQPYIVALTAELLRLRPTDRMLDVGTGSGYAAAVLARLGAEVWSIDVVPALTGRAAKVLARLGIDNVHVATGDGWAGWPDEAPFDAIAVAAAADEVPAALTDQLADGGRLVVPVGPVHGTQELLRVERRGDRLLTERVVDVRFVPLVHPPPTGDRSSAPE